MFDFKVGFIGTTCSNVLPLKPWLCMVAVKKSHQKTVFAGQLIQMYTAALGPWAYPLIGIAALATMIIQH